MNWMEKFKQRIEKKQHEVLENKELPINLQSEPAIRPQLPPKAVATDITLISPEWGEICSVQKQPNPLLSLSFDDSKGTLAQYRPFEAKSSISCHFRVNFTPNRVKKGMLKNEDVYAARV